MQSDGYDRRHTEMMGTTDVNIKTENDNTPLHSAVNTKQIIGSIMPSSEDGANVDTKNNDILMGRIKLSLQHGANVVIDDCDSETSELNRRNSICSDSDIF